MRTWYEGKVAVWYSLILMLWANSAAGLCSAAVNTVSWPWQSGVVFAPAIFIPSSAFGWAVISLSVWLLSSCQAFLIPFPVLLQFLPSHCLFMSDCLLLHFQRCCRCYTEIVLCLTMMCNILIHHVSSVQSRKCEMNFKGKDVLQ